MARFTNAKKQDEQRARVERLTSPLAFSDPPGYVVPEEVFPDIPVVKLTRPSAPVAREMLYDLIRQFGSRHACRMLGFEFTGTRIGTSRDIDRILSAAHVRTIWLIWSVTFCPSNLQHQFHLVTWGIFNDKYEGKSPDLHRASYMKKMASKSVAHRPQVKRDRYSRLPKSIRTLSARSPKKRAAVAAMREQDLKVRRARERRKRRVDRNRARFLADLQRKQNLKAKAVRFPDPAAGVGVPKNT
jgi:hypothetical protein